MRHPVFMLESCFVVRCEEFFVKPVTTCNVSKGETAAFLSSDKKVLYLPTDMPAFQLDFTRYYYPGTVCSPGECLTGLISDQHLFSPYTVTARSNMHAIGIKMMII